MTSPTRVEQIFKQMESYVLTLESDPSALGPEYFVDLIAECRNFLNHASLVTSELNRERLQLGSDIRRLEALYQLDYDNLLATDEDVRKLAAIEDRKSTVQHMLRVQKQEIDAAKEQLHVAEAVGKVVALRSKELNATMTAIRDQKRLMQSEIQSGAMYGDERTPKALQHSRASGAMATDDIGAEELDALIAAEMDEPESESESETEPESEADDSIEEQVDEPEAVEPVEAEAPPVEAEAPPVVVEVQTTPQPEVSPEEQEVLNFLAGSPEVVSVPKTDDEDFSELLDSL